MPEGKKLFDLLDSKSALILGFVTSILVMGTLGFIILLTILLQGGGLSMGASANAPAAPTAAPSAPTAAQPTTPQVVSNLGTGDFPVLGDKNAKVTIVEFADLRCPYCERFYQDAEKSLVKDYVNTGKVAFYFRSFAFLGPESTAASEAAECANEQGQFWKFHDWMYENQADESNTAYYSNDNLIKYATDLGMDKAKFTSCLNSHKYASNVQKDLSDGEAAGVNGTPTVFIDGKPIVGAVPYAQIKAAIDQELATK